MVLRLHKGARDGVIRGDFYVVVPSLFAGLEIYGDDVRVSSTMKKMILRRRRCLLAMVVRKNAIWVLRVRGEDKNGGELLAVREGYGGDELAVATLFRLRFSNVCCGGSN
ncbi:hypothetical protein V8G54_004776 [Vigna mungo]|uniref:Uncharacterized protein n=1 Tax=Vigna mungo TaxID=3915 RepID=A0AAQ3PEG5_VIGMU